MNRSYPRIHAVFAVLILLALGQLAQSLQAGQESGKAEKVVTVEGITEYRMGNGVRFLLFPDPASSTVTVNMTVLVGSRYEGYGETGMAHLLEHMLFKGCKGFPNPWQALTDRGADFNGTTWYDRTNYYESMPATDGNLEFGIKLEAARLTTSFIRHEDLAKEFSVVRNEFEANENSPQTILSQRMMSAAYEWHNYGKTTMGNRSDIEKVPIESLQAFYRKYYQPDNIVLLIAGKFDQDKALEYIERYFGALPRPARKLEEPYTVEPAQDGERSVTLRRVGKVAVVGAVYHIPAAAHPDFAAVEVLDEVLGNTPAGRLYKELVETGKATSVSTSTYALHDPGTFEVLVRVSDSSSPEEVQKIMLTQMENFAGAPVTQEEVDRAKQIIKADFARRMTRSKSLAIYLSEWIGAGDWRLMFVDRDRVAKVKPEDVTRVARQYLKRSNRTLGTYIPVTQVARAVIPPTPSVAKLVDNYKSTKTIAKGEAFDTTPENIEKRVKRLTLPNGLKVALLQKKTRGETVIGSLTLRFGNAKSLYEYKTASGFLGPLMIRGTKKHNRQQLQDLLEKLEAKLNIGSDTGHLTSSWVAKRGTLSGVLEILGEVLREPTFPQSELEILKRSTRQRLQKSMTDPEGLAFRYLTRQLNPYPKDDIRYRPTFEESLQRLEHTTRDQVASLYAEQLGGEQGELVLIGDFDGAAAVSLVEKLLSGWKSGVPYQRIPQTADTKVKGSHKNFDTPDKENAVYLAGETFAMKDTDPDYPAMELGNFILGGSATSRLFDRLRQKEGVSYGAGSELSVESKDEYASWMLYAICNPKNLDKADKSALEVVQRTLKDGITEKELQDGKAALLQDWKLRRGNDNYLGSLLGELLYLGRTFDYIADVEKKISALTRDDVNQALAKYLSPDRLVIVRAGDFSKAK